MMKKPTLAIVIIVMAALMTASVIPVQAQLCHGNNYARTYNSDHGAATDHFTEVIASAMAHRQEKSKVLSIDRYLLDEGNMHIWTNGLAIYLSNYYPQDKEVVFDPYSSTYNSENVISGISSLKVRGRVVSMADKPDVKITVEQVGGNIILVGRNAQGEPVMVLHQVTQQQVNNGAWSDLAQLIMMGNYQTADSVNAVFGPKMPFYSGYKYDKDPGFFDGYYINQDFKSMDILYGNGRPSKGDPSNPNWGKMPGGGGAAAIMGPMEWNIIPTVGGLQVVISHDEKFVSHEPRIGNEGDNVTLTKVQTPFEGLDGKWPIASVLPLNETLLQLFPKEVLTLMRGEIYARYGDTFKNPATQSYFDAQPWYKRKSGNAPIRLTDVEKFNYKLIKYVESTR